MSDLLGDLSIHHQRLCRAFKTRNYQWSLFKDLDGIWYSLLGKRSSTGKRDETNAVRNAASTWNKKVEKSATGWTHFDAPELQECCEAEGVHAVCWKTVKGKTKIVRLHPVVQRLWEESCAEAGKYLQLPPPLL